MSILTDDVALRMERRGLLGRMFVEARLDALLVGMQIGAATVENRFLKKLKIELP